MARTFNSKDFEALQNGMSALSSLAASAPTFQDAIAAARQILGEMFTVEEDRDQALVELDAAKKQIAEIIQEIGARKEQKAAIEIATDAARVNLSNLEGEYASRKKQFDSDFGQHRAKELERVTHEIEATRDVAKASVDKLMAEVAELEWRKATAESALQAIKARI